MANIFYRFWLNCSDFVFRECHAVALRALYVVGCRCFVVDSAGYLVIHEDFITLGGIETPLVENVHITVKVTYVHFMVIYIVGC